MIKGSITYFSVHGFEFGRDFLPLGIGPFGQDVDDCLLIGAEAFEGLLQRPRVFFRAEGGCRQHGGLITN